MKYYKFVVDTPYCGTGSTYYEAYEIEPTEKELDETAADYFQDNVESYAYMVAGWGEEPDEEELEWYYEVCIYYWEEISEEEYLENTEGVPMSFIDNARATVVENVWV